MYTDILNHAIFLRKDKKFAQSRQILFELINSQDQVNGAIYLNIAWAYDNEGREQDALEYYKKALQETLAPPDLFEAMFGLACTYYSLGQFMQAEQLFIKLHEHYPLASEVLPFYALCLQALNKKDEALQILFDLMIEHPPTMAISAYKSAITYYVHKLKY